MVSTGIKKTAIGIFLTALYFTGRITSVGLFYAVGFGTDRDQEDGDAGMTRREAVALLSSVASALAGLATPSAVRILGMTGVEAADPLIIGALHGVSCFDYNQL